MSNFGSKILFLGIALAVAGLAADKPATKVKTVPVRLSGSIDGAELYREHCAVCHGIDAKGKGPAAAALKKAPTDLTVISRANGGKFPAIAVQEKIRGGEIIEHGTVDMPMWGKLLVPMGRNKTDADVRIFALLQYVEKIQVQ
jgi:mono/diheme cytochrome c family protein